MEVDTGATLSVISKATYNRAWREEPPPLAPSTARLRTYTGEEIPVMGEIEVDVCHRYQQKRLTLIVTEGNGPSLLGRNWLIELRLNWKTTYQVRNSSALATVLDDHKEIFRKELGTITCAKAEIHVDPQVPPSFHRPRHVPFALKQKVEAELERLKREGIIRPRKFSQWAAPIVAVPKSDGSVRLCGESANKAIVCDTHPIHQSTPGSGLKNPGADYTSITQDRLGVKFFLSSWTHTQNGSTCTLFHRHPRQRPSTSYVRHLPPMASQKRLSLTHSLQVSSKSFCDPLE